MSTVSDVKSMSARYARATNLDWWPLTKDTEAGIAQRKILAAEWRLYRKWDAMTPAERDKMER